MSPWFNSYIFVGLLSECVVVDDNEVMLFAEVFAVVVGEMWRVGWECSSLDGGRVAGEVRERRGFLTLLVAWGEMRVAEDLRRLEVSDFEAMVGFGTKADFFFFPISSFSNPSSKSSPPKSYSSTMIEDDFSEVDVNANNDDGTGSVLPSLTRELASFPVVVL